LFGCAKLSFYNQFELPDYYSNYGEEFELSEEERDKYWDLCDLEEMTINKILGHSNNIQGEMELECELVTNGIYCGSPEGYKSEKAKELAKNYKHWNLLLQIDSNDEANMMWGDVGRIYLWITDEDLKNKNFENSWLILQCG